MKIVKFVYKEIVRPRLRNKGETTKRNWTRGKKEFKRMCMCVCNTERLDVSRRWKEKIKLRRKRGKMLMLCEAKFQL